MDCGSASVAGRMRRRERRSGGPEAGRLTALPLGEWRRVRAAAQCDIGTDRGGSLVGQGKGETRRKREDLVLEGRTGVEEARTSVDPEGLADNDIHRLVRVTAF
jgi:hypothetical protein